jgi:diguanylate cyclase (GGDEF)-like protein
MNDALLVNRVADTTARRDRDELDLAISHLLAQFLDAQSISLLRLVDDGATRRVVKRATVNAAREETGSESANTPSELPALSEFPSLEECAARVDIVCATRANGQLETVFPIVNEREVTGMLVVRTERPLESRDTGLIRGILRILQNHLALLEYGERDTLTSLLNRKTFEAQFAKLHQRVTSPDRRTPATESEPSWLALMDIDKFKSINDTYGHLFGDEVLLLTSQLMKRNFRGADQLFRFGGEEFVIVLDHASEAGARVALERLRTTIEAYPFPQVGHVTLSIGYTQISTKDASTICVERADAALYYAKTHGRNCVHSYEALVAKGELQPAADNGEIELF